MTQFQVLARPLALAAMVTCVFAGGLAGWPSTGEARKAKSGSQAAQPAQGPQAGQNGDGSDAEQKAAAAAAAHKAYDAGLKEYAAGRYQNAIGQLTIAVKAGVLSTSEMAKALYTRGLAYKRDNKAGLAISDLTSAIWLKNGLSPSDQKSAAAERSEAYRMAGLADTGTTPDRPAVVATPAAPAATGANVVANPAPGPNAGSAGLSAAAIAEAAGKQNSGGSGSGDGTAATIARQDAGSAQSDPSLQSAASATVSDGPAPAPASSGSSFGQTVSAIPGNVSGFFSNMFGGGSSAAPPPPAPSGTVTTASTSQTAPETSSWSNTTTVAAGAPTKTTKVALADTKTNPVATKGRYKIHIAALRSRAEAEQLAQNLIAQHGADLSNHVPTVDEAVIGSMGTFYRVRIGGYASQEEPRGLCNKLRSSGLDCLVVTN